MPARSAALVTIRQTWDSSRWPFFRLLNTGASAGASCCKSLQRFPNTSGHEDGPGLAAFAEDGDLARRIPLLKMPPLQGADFRNAETTSVEGEQDCPISRIRFQRNDPQHLGLTENPLGQLVTKAGNPQGTANVELEVAQPETEGEQAFDRRHCPMHGGRLQPGIDQVVGEA